MGETLGMTQHGTKFLSTYETGKQVIPKIQWWGRDRIKVIDFPIPKGIKW